MTPHKKKPRAVLAAKGFQDLEAGNLKSHQNSPQKRPTQAMIDAARDAFAPLLPLEIDDTAPESEPVYRDGKLVGTVRVHPLFGFEARVYDGRNLGRYNAPEHAAAALIAVVSI